MSRERTEIDRVRTNIASAVYNDCLPTSLTTNSLMEICVQYDNYVNASQKERGGYSESKQEEALKAIKASVNLINKQSLNSGAGHGILYPKGDSLEDMRDIGETIAIIYAIPYKANVEMDYVGYAYGISALKFKCQRPYESFAPDEYINQCSAAILDYGTARESKDIMRKMSACADAFDYFKSIESGEVRGNPLNIQNLMKARVESIDAEIESFAKFKPQHSDNEIAAQLISACMKAGIQFSYPQRIEELRDENIFQNHQALDDMLEI